MCEYRLELGDAVTQFACMHAAVPAGLTPFQVFACDDGAVGLLGEFDVASRTAFERAMQRIQPTPDDSKLIFDMSASSSTAHPGLGLWLIHQLDIDVALNHAGDGFTVRLRGGATTG